jgi:predicted nucleic acid-binding protein
MALKTKRRPRGAAAESFSRRETKKSAEAYLDTSAFIAFLDRSDSYHAIFKRVFAAPPPLVTSALVVAEAHGWFLRRYDARRATEFLSFLEALPALTIVAFDSVELAKQRPILSRFGDQNLTLADTHGLVIMRERKTAICWSTDRHLALLGAELIIRL